MQHLFSDQCKISKPPAYEKTNERQHNLFVYAGAYGWAKDFMTGEGR